MASRKSRISSRDESSPPKKVTRQSSRTVSRESLGGESSHPQELAHQITGPKSTRPMASRKSRISSRDESSPPRKITRRSHDTLEEKPGGDQNGCISEEYGKKPPKGADNPVASTSIQETPEITDKSIEESIQVCGNELERDWSDQLWKRCENKEIHKNYISAEDFRRNGKDRLPARYQTDDWFNLVIAFMNLTVRIVVYRHSPKRPNPIIGDEPSFGSGFITRCYDTFDANGNREWRFMINTAKHVIFDESEVKNARFDLFYESEDSNVESLVGSRFIGFREDHDNIWFDVLTKDKVLEKKIIETFETLMDLRRKVFFNHYPEAFGPRERSDFSKTPKDIVIISHPHGKPKKISMGEVLKRDVVEDWYRRETRYNKGYLMEWLECFYNAPTCKGSSGAEILFLGDEGERGRYGWTIGAHKCKKDGTGFGIGILYTYDSGWNKIFF